MIHYELTPQERTQIDGRWHGAKAPLCATGDGHYVGTNGNDWEGQSPYTIDCLRCIERRDLIAKRDRDRVRWATN
jgi:hypothetical protein